jgi:hypothetical protein
MLPKMESITKRWSSVAAPLVDYSALPLFVPSPSLSRSILPLFPTACCYILRHLSLESLHWRSIIRNMPRSNHIPFVGEHAYEGEDGWTPNPLYPQFYVAPNHPLWSKKRGRAFIYYISSEAEYMRKRGLWERTTTIPDGQTPSELRRQGVLVLSHGDAVFVRIRGAKDEFSDIITFYGVDLRQLLVGRLLHLLRKLQSIQQRIAGPVKERSLWDPATKEGGVAFQKANGRNRPGKQGPCCFQNGNSISPGVGRISPCKNSQFDVEGSSDDDRDLRKETNLVCLSRLSRLIIVTHKLSYPCRLPRKSLTSLLNTAFQNHTWM